MSLTLVVIAKAPRAGLVKTRLCPPCTPAQAASLAEAALADTLAAVAATPAQRRLLALDGAPGDWLPAGFDVVPQPSGGLAGRIAAALSAAGGRALLIGMDTPQVTPELLADAAAGLDDADAVLGRASDGGYWALGLRAPDPRALEGVPMSAPDTGAAQARRLQELGLSCRDLPVLRDIDAFDDALAVADAAPATRFAGLLSALDVQRTAA